ncbi:amino acid ABC transporter substrate-binding protein [Faecalibaculum rodentium]|jgi:polar amino acid transport system substrate-binding protein|uniref:amino acid ABC transporter substrate-binding protein n=1 Tax=Faecalibaculum rodentium TaxID=1702221 RepID=UPI0023F32C91|nr:transporter substrate-binding domain-containing protein [Faecalibaculum rodentium]
MKKRMAALFCAGILLAGCAGTATEDQAAADAKDTGDKQTFTVGFDAEFPPYGYKDENGEYTGFDLELAQAVADMEGWELVKQPIDWDAKDMELSSGTIDCIWNGFTMDGREDQYTFSTPYIDNSQVFVVPADSDVKTAEDLAGKNVGVQKDSSALAALESEDHKALMDSFANLTQYADYNTAMMDLEAGGLDAVAMDVGVADYQLASREGEFRKLEKPLASEVYAIGFLKGNDELKDKVQEDVYKLYDDGTVDKIADKYGLKDFLVIDKYRADKAD